jgi:hypothetical protein
MEGLAGVVVSLPDGTGSGSRRSRVRADSYQLVRSVTLLMLKEAAAAAVEDEIDSGE